MRAWIRRHTITSPASTMATCKMRDMKQGALIMPAGLGTVESQQVDGTLTDTAPTPHVLVDLPISGGSSPSRPKNTLPHCRGRPCWALAGQQQQQQLSQ